MRMVKCSQHERVGEEPQLPEQHPREVRHYVAGQEPLLSEDIMHGMCQGSGGQPQHQGTGGEPLLSKDIEYNMYNGSGGLHQHVEYGPDGQDGQQHVRAGQGEGLEPGVVLDNIIYICKIKLDRGLVKSSRRGRRAEPTRIRHTIFVTSILPFLNCGQI